MLPPNFREMMRMNVVCFLLFLFARKMKMMGNAVPYSDLSVCRFPGDLKLVSYGGERLKDRVV
jgi:hypothetical protein